ncbi:MAG: ADP-glyceromanno-heptose 6-epimerase [Betaproteobacteria bacterium]|jgi:ADP-L-glycero-D-manno-heptose 6-epimerase|nr:ADP-glyceromanno-heptose 6-epimerase [Betaproteobacteria bacterium]
MIIVTGGAGLIGSNVIEQLNQRGHTDVLVVDHLKNGHKMHNLADLHIRDYLDRDDFMARIQSGQDMGQVSAVFHLGACSSTTEWDGQFMMRNNFEYSKQLLHWCQRVNASYIYASSASVYGLGKNGFSENRSAELPINMYAYSKFQFDQYVRSLQGRLRHQVVGLRYFNVYGPREAHKGSMSSTAFHFNRQLHSEGVCRLFEGTDGYGNGEQLRDFVYVGDCAKVNLWFMDHAHVNGIFNLGTGQANSFNAVANAVLAWHQQQRQAHGRIEYIPFPEHLKGAYQSYTQADISALRRAGYHERFLNVDEGVNAYLDWLHRD